MLCETRIDTDDQAEVTLPTKQEDVDALWSQARSELRVSPEKLKEKRSPETKRNDGEYSFSVLHFYLQPFPPWGFLPHHSYAHPYVPLLATVRFVCGSLPYPLPPHSSRLHSTPLCTLFASLTAHIANNQRTEHSEQTSSSSS
jgi:hypothetical protein